ncbi:Protein phosphatase 1 regulatory subunit 36 [Anthophora plagiata]
MEDKYFAWDEISDGLILLSTQKTEDKHVKKIKQQSDPVHQSNVYSPHAYLILNFHETLSQREQLQFRKYYLRKVPPNEPDVIILQDIKDLVMFLLASPISPQFVNFFHLPIVDRFLRAIVIYFQYYVMTWEELMNERAATMKKAPNPLAQGHRFRFTEEMQNLRFILGREYADLIIGCQDSIQYHHMTGGKKGESMVQSQGEKDLRMFEVLICMAHRIVWIALERKYFYLIEVELHRLFRTDGYNMAKRLHASHIVQDMLINDILVLQGHMDQEKRKLLRNSPLIQDLIYSDCDYRLLSLGIEDDPHDEHIRFLQNALLAEEDKLHELGIKIGILGENRANYDIMLMPLEEEEKDDDILQLSDRRKYERKSTKDTLQDVQIPIKLRRLPSFRTKFELTQDFLMKAINISPRGYKAAREQGRRKWFIREVKRQRFKEADTYSVMTMLD